MTKLEELEQKQQELIEQQYEIAKQIEELKQNEKKKWQPKEKEVYYYVDGCGDVEQCTYSNIYYDKWRTSQDNCFKTEREATQYLRNLKTKIELKQLADELNGSQVMDWTDNQQRKRTLILSCKSDLLWQASHTTHKNPSAIYCLDKDFADKAIARIGEERLINMIKSGV